MQFLADESCDFNIVRALRSAGHEVLAVSEIARRAKDSAVIRLAGEQRRVLLTEDKDFGQLVFAGGASSTGVVLLRYRLEARATLIQTVLEPIEKKGDQLPKYFAVVQPGKVRLRRR